MPPLAFALVPTVGLLITMGFFTLGSLPLLVLKHDTPLDAHFIRGLFHYYYMAVMFTAVAAAAGYAFARKPVFSLGMCCIVGVALLLRHTVLSRMDLVRGTMTATDKAAISRFRRLHIGGMLANIVQLGGVAWGLTYLGPIA
ncbi:MAG: hypothetical protein JWQ07_1453 [Ramlibacter sp.]|nr:hypothetical protein [Ramlibacter sp.]